MTKKPEIVLVYNPILLGRTPSIRLADILAKIMEFGFIVNAFPLQQKAWTGEPLSLLQSAAAVIVAGGDGSLNITVNALLHPASEVNLPPIGILPWGTTNDFARYLGGGKIYNPEQLLHSIIHHRVVAADLGVVNNRLFVNVAGGGLLADISHKTGANLKKKLGMLAYYLEGARKFPAYRPYSLHLKTGNLDEKMEIYLFLVMNSKMAGGFQQMAPRASINDGKLDLIIIKKAATLTGVLNIFAKVLEGRHLQDPRVRYLQVEQLELDGPAAMDINIDGEKGFSFPLFFRVLQRRLSFFYA